MKSFSVTLAQSLLKEYQNSSVRFDETFEEFVMDKVHDIDDGLYEQIIDEDEPMIIGKQVNRFLEFCERVCPSSYGTPYPSIDEYFTTCVPKEYFISMLGELMDDYVAKSTNPDCKNIEDVFHRINVLSTFVSVLEHSDNTDEHLS